MCGRLTGHGCRWSLSLFDIFFFHYFCTAYDMYIQSTVNTIHTSSPSPPRHAGDSMVWALVEKEHEIIDIFIKANKEIIAFPSTVKSFFHRQKTPRSNFFAWRIFFFSFLFSFLSSGLTVGKS